MQRYLFSQWLCALNYTKELVDSSLRGVSVHWQVLQEKGIHIWDGNASREYLDG